MAINNKIYSHLGSQSNHTSNQQLRRSDHLPAPQSYIPSNTNLQTLLAHSSPAQYRMTSSETTNNQSEGPPGLVISGRGSVQTLLASVVPQESLPRSSPHTGQNTGRPSKVQNTSKVKNTSTTKQGDNVPRPNIREINSILKNLAKDRQPAIAQPSAQSAPPGKEDALPNKGESGVADCNKGIETEEVPTSVHRKTGNNESHRLPAGDQICEGENGADIDNEGDTRIDEVPDNVLEEISGMDLDESLHAENKRLPAYLKAELNDMYYEFERQLHIFAIRFQLHVALLYMHIGLINKMRGATNYNNFCRFDPKAREILLSEEPLKQRCKDVAKVWATIDPETKSKYKDPAYIETIRGDVPMLVVNGCIQTHVANTSLNLACNQKSTTFVRRWAHDTIQRMNKLYTCHHIQGFLVIALGMAVIDKLVNSAPADTPEKSVPGPVVQKRKHADIVIMEAEDAEKTDEHTNDNITNEAELAAKKVKLNRKAANKRSNQKKSTLDDDSEEEAVESLDSEKDSDSERDDLDEEN
ncbi:hypothetical protein PSHT_13992 [Puccinia striiformis]|uniref:Uncharacterized protein n=1 Tax=Puccinia striiformis TaxID=27350 RepID=A0A2S4UMK1_9BASI|nr:hypothetical protein PSHT_13992 [Puccinia striiformis]